LVNFLVGCSVVVDVGGVAGFSRFVWRGWWWRPPFDGVWWAWVWVGLCVRVGVGLGGAV